HQYLPRDCISGPTGGFFFCGYAGSLQAPWSAPVRGRSNIRTPRRVRNNETTLHFLRCCARRRAHSAASTTLDAPHRATPIPSALLQISLSTMIPADMRILVVEDDPKIASFIVKGLKQSGYAVDHCGDGEEGLVVAETTPYDAAIVDLMLPRLDGLTLIQRMRSKGLRTPVLILSAKTSVDDRVKGLQAG